MSDIIEYRIFGDDLQLVEIELDPDETVRAEVGTMTYEGLFLATLTGPGKVYLQSLPLGAAGRPHPGRGPLLARRRGDPGRRRLGQQAAGRHHQRPLVPCQVIFRTASS